MDDKELRFVIHCVIAKAQKPKMGEPETLAMHRLLHPDQPKKMSHVNKARTQENCPPYTPEDVAQWLKDRETARSSPAWETYLNQARSEARPNGRFYERRRKKMRAVGTLPRPNGTEST